MADALDCGFDWANYPSIITYGFATDDGGSWEQRPGASDTIDARHQLYFSFFETSETDPSTMLLKEVEITFECTEGSIYNPIGGWGAPTNKTQEKTYELDATGQPNGWSAGLQQHGTGWSVGPLTFNSALQRSTCTYEVSIAITFSDGSTTRRWFMDPTLIIGGRE
ncbi:MAG TPA: hypothetical protein VLV83_25045 [Acidobacteriota bacterium]|nr:hypothetical protein [Acidobacteriota bacterium]